MRLRPRPPMLARFALALFVSLAILTQSACIGGKTRDTVGVEALGLVASAIVEDASAAIPNLPPGEQGNTAGKLAAFEGAIASRDRATIIADALPRWTDVRSLAEAGITQREQAGLIGPGVAASKRERLAKFDALLNRTTEPGR